MKAQCECVCLGLYVFITHRFMGPPPQSKDAQIHPTTPLWSMLSPLHTASFLTRYSSVWPTPAHFSRLSPQVISFKKLSPLLHWLVYKRSGFLPWDPRASTASLTTALLVYCHLLSQPLHSQRSRAASLTPLHHQDLAYSLTHSGGSLFAECNWTLRRINVPWQRAKPYTSKTVM